MHLPILIVGHKYIPLHLLPHETVSSDRRLRNEEFHSQKSPVSDALKRKDKLTRGIKESLMGTPVYTTKFCSG